MSPNMQEASLTELAEVEGGSNLDSALFTAGGVALGLGLAASGVGLVGSVAALGVLYGYQGLVTGNWGGGWGGIASRLGRTMMEL